MLLVLVAHAVLIGAVLIALGLRDRNPFALAALALLTVATVDLGVRQVRARARRADRLGPRGVLGRLRGSSGSSRRASTSSEFEARGMLADP